MRSFTLVEGTSSKFWEVGRVGAEVTVRFGRIGAQGQTQVKELADDQVAAAHLDKLVSEKLKKGYAESAAGAAVTTPAPTAVARKPAAVLTAGRASEPSPPSDEDPVPDEDEWLIPSSWQRDITPIRGVDPTPSVTLDPAAADALVGPLLDAARTRIEDPATEDDLRQAGMAALGAPARGLLRRATPPAPTPLGLAVVVAAVCVGARATQTYDEVSQALATRLWLDQPPAVVVETAIELADLHIHLDTGHRPGLRRQSSVQDWERGVNVPFVELIQRLVASLDDRAYDAVVDALAELRDRPHGREVAAFLAPTRQDWVHDAATVGGTTGDWPLVLAVTTTLDDATAVLSRAGHTGGWLLHCHARWTSVAAHLGPAAVPLLLTHFFDASADAKRNVLRLLSAIRTDEAFAGLVAHLTTKGVPEAVLKAKEDQPFRATRILAETAAGGRGTARLAAGLLRSHLSAHPETRAVAPMLSAGARSAMERATAVEDHRPLAVPEQLPRVLVQAPWERRRSTPKAVVVPGLVPRLAPAVAWLPGEREQALLPERPWMLQRNEGSWDTALKKADGWTMLTLLSVAPAEIGRRYLDRFVPSPYGSSTAEGALGLLANLDIDAVPIILGLNGSPAPRGQSVQPVRSVEVAELMADYFARSKLGRPAARAWFARHPEAAALALVPAAVGKPGRERRSAERALRYLASHDGVVQAAAAAYGPDAAAAVDALLAVDPLDVLPPKVPALPQWVDLALLPAVLTADRSARLDRDAVSRLLTCLQLSSDGEPYAGLEAALPALDAASVAACAWEALEGWRLAGEPSKDSWVLTVQGLVGDGETARRLAPLVNAWPKLGGTTKANTGIEVLCAIGTDVALMHLHRLSQRATSRPLREKAQILIQRVADERGLSAEELADRLVPDLGLDPDGRLLLDYGPRQFVVGFDEALKPYVEEDGRRRSALPKPGVKDDPQRAPAAYAAFTALKKDVRTVATEQLRRFERAMVNQRRWSADDLRALFVEHPLMWHLARRVVWCAFDADGAPTLSFRIAEDRTLADREDQEVSLSGDASVGIAHPIHLAGHLGAWGELFADYEILQPFPQLGREVLALTSQELPGDLLTRFASTPVEAKRLYGLAARGWERADPADAGWQGSLVKALPGGLMAIVNLEPGLIIGDINFAPEQTLTSVQVVLAGENAWDHGPTVPLSTLDEITASELLRDLTRVAQAS